MIEMLSQQGYDGHSMQHAWEVRDTELLSEIRKEIDSWQDLDRGGKKNNEDGV
jgi:hypothetical protein